MKVFNINLKYIVKKEQAKRWYAVLDELKEMDDDAIIEELERVVGIVGPDKPRLYYLEAVRRNLNLKKHYEFKKVGMPQQIKDLFK